MIIRSLILFLLLSLITSADASAQGAVNAGRKFAFGIPEGPDRQVPSGVGESRIFLTFLGSTNGCAVIKGPDGFSASVNFTGTREREIEIPVSYMQKWEEGYNKKGFIVETTQPASVELHVVFTSAGESTHIFPMEMLDGDYLLSGWSLFNDTVASENNRAQFLITAAEDNTQVTITAPNGLLPNIAPGTTFTVTLNAGECYIGKMDSTLNRDLTTSQVMIKASKAINVLQANTCGYVPYGVQSCNMLLDNALPRKYFDTKFYMQPISRDVRSDHVLLTSDRLNFNAVTSDGTFYQTNDGRLDIIIDKPSMIETDAPAMAQVLTPGSAQSSLGQSDPTWVILPSEQIWDDTLKWYAQPPVGGSEAFLHYITIAGPAAAFNEIMIDDAKLSDLTTSNLITGTSMFTARAAVPQGAHTLKSPVPVGAIVNGIRKDDGYSLLPGGTLPNRYQPRPVALIDLNATEAQFCGELNAQLVNTLTISSADKVTEVNASINYDQSILRLISATPGSFFQTITGATVDLSTPGVINIQVRAGTYLAGDGTLIDAVFAVDADVPTTLLTGKLTLVNDEICDNSRSFVVDLPVSVVKTTEQGTASISLTDIAAKQSGIATSELIVSGLAADADVKDFDVILEWNRDLIELESAVQTGTTTDNWTVTRTDETVSRVRLHFAPPPGQILTNGVAAKLEFKAFLTDVKSTDIRVNAILPSLRKCPLTLSVQESSATFDLELLCGEGLIVDHMANGVGARVLQAQIHDLISLDLTEPLSGSAFLYDLLGKLRASWPLGSGKHLKLPLPEGIEAGRYSLRIQSPVFRQDLPIVIQK
jgi:hypothetical protein